MAESQLTCMDDGHINEKIPESKPEFFYSEEQRAALEQLLKNGDGAFKMRLKEDNVKDFLSAREIKWIRKILQEYKTEEDEDKVESATTPKDSSSIHSTYCPELSDVEIPPLDIGWPTGGFFKGVTRVTVHTHPPKDNGPHIKEIVRKLIQESNKVVAIVMDLLTDLQILQDLLDAASRRSVSVYIVLDVRAVPHFLDMCNRLQVGSQHLRKIRARTVKGTGFNLSYGNIPGSLCSKYMLIDGDKVMFGSYSFSWSSARMDRNTITVMTGQVVDFFDRDFRELYASSDKLDLYGEFHVSRPPPGPPVQAAAEPQQPPLVASASRFQVSLGEQGNLKVPAHKYHNPKYSLVFGDAHRPTGSLQDLTSREELAPPAADGPDPDTKPTQVSGETMDKLGPLPSPTGKGSSKKLNRLRPSIKSFFKGKGANQSAVAGGDGKATPPSTSPTRKTPNGTEEAEDGFEELVSEKLKGKGRRSSKLHSRSVSLQTVNTQDEDGPKSHRRPQKKCIQS